MDLREVTSKDQGQHSTLETAVDANKDKPEMFRSLHPAILSDRSPDSTPLHPDSVLTAPRFWLQ